MRPTFSRTAAALALCAVSFTALAADAAPNAASRRLHQLVDADWQWQLQEYPEFATSLGDNRFNDRLTDQSATAVARRSAHQQAFHLALQSIAENQLRGQDRITLEILHSNDAQAERLKRIYGKLPFSASDDWMVLSQMDGIHQSLPALAKASPFNTVRDYENYLKRLAALPTHLAQLTLRMQQGIQSGWMPPAIALRAVPEQIATHLETDPQKAILYRPFLDMPATISAAEQSRLQAAGRSAIADSVVPSFTKLQRFMIEKYLPACRTELGATTLPGGAAFYQAMINGQTTTNLSPKEIHELGLKEVARINAEMDATMRSTGFKGDRAAFQHFINTDAQFTFTRGSDMLARYRDIAKRADAELPRFFAELPRLPYGIRAMEAYEGDNAAHYTSGSAKGGRAGYFEANVNNPTKSTWYGMESLVMHEAVPGHHLQIARAQELQGLPEFRKNSNFNAYAEGWALYAESLGGELGMYTDPYSKFGQLAGEMWRATRLVIDTGIHAFGWSRDQAIAYKETNAAASHEEAVAEIDRYIVWPGQALGYKLGELRIKALRAKASAALGERFDLRKFHNAVLDNGALPLDVLDQQIDLWIAQQQKTAS
ncbi:uncharacterized protein (DUF885 family) [Actimicrobium sp. GrIS 1.19]|uniref:DUF885 domain-containing protein n=1 Tax=Actimicrobium sp. GrIS 1.19 TaxID=3071708 RepID=UPI002E08EB29|nr:uncharacterized protein (DUF885 family) [Actimicrobium sp. GrIS 1.19]